MTANVETMMSASNVTPWHGIGVIVETAPNSDEALRLAGLDWDVISSPVAVGGITRPEFVANVRSDNNEVLGIVSGKYKIVQNKEAFAFTDALLENGDVRYETAGSLRGGKQIWVMAKVNEEFKILGDDVEPFLCFSNSHDGYGSIRVLMTPVRVVCQNTLNLALSSAKRAWSTVHKGDIQVRLAEAQRTLGLAKDYMEGLNEVAELLEQKTVTKATFDEIVNAVLPINPLKDSDRTVATMMAKRADLTARLDAEDIKKFDGTGWAVVNAVTDFVAHSVPARQTATYKENLFSNVINGHAMVDQAVKIILAA